MLTVTGIPEKDSKLIKKYAYFCISRFVPNSTLKNALIQINIIDRDTLPDSAERKELKESSAWVQYKGTSANGKRKFIVTLDKVLIKTTAKKQITRYKALLKELGHEMIHIKQYLLNEMFDYKDDVTVRFVGEKYTYTGAELDWSYWESPWEIEAYGRMEGLYQMFLKLLKEEKKS